MNINISYFYMEYRYENYLFPELSYQNKYHLFEALSFLYKWFKAIWIIVSY